ncbi:MAG TPA: hypothetical protein VMC42_05575 [Methanoregulaceae archaeon]|nr:hypothetical protein [Methanoregulaceae archaeon]
MAFQWDPVIFVNLVLCIVIVLLGLIIYRKSRERLPLYIAMAFGLFGISHAATLAGFAPLLTVPLIIIRALAYLLVIYALFSHLRSSVMQKEARRAWVEFFKEDSGAEEPYQEN